MGLVYRDDVSGLDIPPGGKVIKVWYEVHTVLDEAGATQLESRGEGTFAGWTSVVLAAQAKAAG